MKALFTRIRNANSDPVNTIAAIAVFAGSVFGFITLLDRHYLASIILFSIALVFSILWAMIGLVISYRKPTLAMLTESHLGSKWASGTIIQQRIPLRDRPSLQMAIQKLKLDSKNVAEPFGLAWYNTIMDAINYAKMPIPLRWSNLPKSLTEHEPCVDNAIYFLRTAKETPFMIYVIPGRLEVLAATDVGSKEAMKAMLDEMASRSVYRGQVVSVDPSEATEDGDPDYMIRFHEMPLVSRDQIILPEELLKVIERNVIGLLANADRLRKAGRSTRHGLLFHGPPGVGKTMVTKYLARACPNYTVILLTGRQLGLVRESCRLARLLDPALVVIEDIDLIALDRERNGNSALLHDLMDEMDGLGPKADVIFLMTTNRAEALEPALASRPGRVDQAVLFPLPDADCRRRLFQHFGANLDIQGIDVENLVERTDGASPAFIQELFRKAAMFAVERNDLSDPLKVTSADFEAAIRELIEFGGDLTRNLLGFRKKVGF